MSEAAALKGWLSLSDQIRVHEVSSPADFKLFVDLPWTIYREDPFWVPPLKMAVRDLLDVAKNPFFQHAKRVLWLAYRGDECVGRIAGILDPVHNQFHQENVVFFGFFEVKREATAAAHALLEAVQAWGSAQGMQVVRGPMNPSVNHECGLLVEGFQDPPTVMSTYNPDYYALMLETWGLAKAKDLWAYRIEYQEQFSTRFQKHQDRLKKRSKVTFRSIRLDRFTEEVDLLLEIYNDAWEKNWGFVPMSPAEFRYLAADLKLIIQPELCLVAELNGQAIGFSLALPDVNQAIQRVKSGQLLPFGFLSLLWNIKGPGRHRVIKRCRIITLGIKKDAVQLGVGPLLYSEYFTRCKRLGYTSGEASWVLEDNHAMNRAMEMMGGTRSKVYRVYERGV